MSGFGMEDVEDPVQAMLQMAEAHLLVYEWAKRSGDDGVVYRFVGCGEGPEGAPPLQVVKEEGEDPGLVAITATVRLEQMYGQKCRVCGCTDHSGCPTNKKGKKTDAENAVSACYWIESDLCSACKGK